MSPGESSGAAPPFTAKVPTVVEIVFGNAENTPNEPHQIQLAGLSVELALLLSADPMFAGSAASGLMSFSSGGTNVLFTTSLVLRTHDPAVFGSNDAWGGLVCVRT